jgi:pimeloyl-ACP methyl ester carboxylesterase
LIPPAGSTASTWGALASDLAGAGRVIAYDWRGYSRSGGETVRSASAHALDAVALLEALEARPAVVVGTSAGATIALDLAARRPDLGDGVPALGPAGPDSCARGAGGRWAPPGGARGPQAPPAAVLGGGGGGGWGAGGVGPRDTVTSRADRTGELRLGSLYPGELQADGTVTTDRIPYRAMAGALAAVVAR